MAAMEAEHPKESEMLAPVLRLFPKPQFSRYLQVPLGRKRIDLLCIQRGGDGAATAIELKIDNWRTALWQALHDLQVAETAYIAMWHEYVHRAEKHRSLLEQYGVGVIAVHPRSADFVFNARDEVLRIARHHKPDFYQMLLTQA